MSIRSHPIVVATISFVRPIVARLIAVRIVESSVVLAAQAFLALFPLVIVVAALAPRGVSTGILDEMRSRFGLAGESEGALQKLVEDPGAIQESLSAVSVLLVLGSATAFTRALQRVYQNAWGLPKLGVRGLWRGFAWLIGLVAYLSVLGVVAHYIHHGSVVQPLAGILGFVLWWWTPFILLGGRVRARVLLPAAFIITVAQLVATRVSTVIMPRTIRNNEANYGPVGVVFAFESWLIVVMGILVAGTTLGAIIGLSRGWFGTFVRGNPDPESWRREVSLPRFTRAVAERRRRSRGETRQADHSVSDSNGAGDEQEPMADRTSTVEREGYPARGPTISGHVISAQKASDHEERRDPRNRDSAGPPAT